LNLSDIIPEFRAVAWFLMLSIPTTLLEHCMFVICGHTKHYLPRPDGSLIIAVKPQAIEELRTAAIFLFCFM
jgi:hypothetical protein